LELAHFVEVETGRSQVVARHPSASTSAGKRRARAAAVSRVIDARRLDGEVRLSRQMACFSSLVSACSVTRFSSSRAPATSLIQAVSAAATAARRLNLVQLRQDIFQAEQVVLQVVERGLIGRERAAP